MTPRSSGLDRSAAADRIAETSFECARADSRIGLEFEWLTYDHHDRSRRPSVAEIRDAAENGGPIVGGAHITIEPGAQVELVTPALDALDEAIRVGRSANREPRRMERGGIDLVGVGLDPYRAPVNLLHDVPRYAAMERLFAGQGPAGVRMMANSASLQVNIDLDPTGQRWRLANQLGPVLVAAFANSPGRNGGLSGWRSARLANWFEIDATRTSPVPVSSDPVATWTDYALGATVLMVERDGAPVLFDRPTSFGRWMQDGHRIGRPTLEDLDAHMTTLFPPVRPRGWLELRYLDALDEAWWPTAVAVIVGLIYDGQTARQAEAAVAPVAGRWLEAAHCGLSSDRLAEVADRCAALALVGLDRLGAGDETIGEVREWACTALAARRSPCDATPAMVG